MHSLETIAERIHHSFEARTAARDRALSLARTLTRHCAHAIRAVHRDESDVVQIELDGARANILSIKTDLSEYPDLYYAGYTQDALKEFAEASIVDALVKNDSIPTPEELGIEDSTYLNGLAEAAGELRRRCLDILRHGYSQESERLLTHMDDIYAVLITMDYPDAITGGLRRQTDIVRSLLERTRGDLTISLQQENLTQDLRRVEAQLIKQSISSS